MSTNYLLAFFVRQPLVVSNMLFSFVQRSCSPFHEVVKSKIEFCSCPFFLDRAVNVNNSGQ